MAEGIVCKQQLALLSQKTFSVFRRFCCMVIFFFFLKRSHPSHTYFWKKLSDSFFFSPLF